MSNTQDLPSLILANTAQRDKPLVQSIINSGIPIRWTGGQYSYYSQGAIYISTSLPASAMPESLVHEYGHNIFKDFMSADLQAAYQSKNVAAGVDVFAMREAIAVAYEYTSGISALSSSYVSRTEVEAAYLQVSSTMLPGTTYREFMESIAREISSSIIYGHITNLTDRVITWYNNPYAAVTDSPIQYSLEPLIQVSFQGATYTVSQYESLSTSTLTSLASDLFAGSYLNTPIEVKYIGVDGVNMSGTIWTPPPGAEHSVDEIIEDVGTFTAGLNSVAETGNLESIMGYWQATMSGWNQAGQMLDSYFGQIYSADPSGKWSRTPYMPELIYRPPTESLQQNGSERGTRATSMQSAAALVEMASAFHPPSGFANDGAAFNNQSKQSFLTELAAAQY